MATATGYPIRRIGATSPTLTAARVLPVPTYSISPPAIDVNIKRLERVNEASLRIN